MKIEKVDNRIVVIPETQADKEIIVDMIERANIEELTYITHSDRFIFSQADWDKVIKINGNI